MQHTEVTKGKGHHPRPPHTVKIHVDGEKKEILSGTYVVSDLKKELGVAAEYELDIVNHGEFHPLDDSDCIEIRGHEKFVSHVRTGGSS